MADFVQLRMSRFDCVMADFVQFGILRMSRFDCVNTPPQVGAWRSVMPNLHRKWWKSSWPKALVKMSAICSCDDVWTAVKRPDRILSRIMWQSISICLLRSWNNGLWAMRRANWLSQCKLKGSGWEIPKSARSCFNQLSSQVVTAMARYSASAEERATVVCFLVRHEIGLVPSWMK